MGEAGQRPIDLLQAARAAVLSAASESSGRPSSMQCHVDAALGDELLTCGRVDEAEAILSDAAEVYRSCGWWGPLWPVLISLRECAARQKKTAAHIEVSLEAAAIAADSDAAQRRALAEAAVGELQGHDAPAMHFTCSTTRAPWASVVEVAAGFASRKDAPPRLAMALRNKLPIPLPLGSCSASFDDSQGTFHGHFEGGTLDPGRWAVNYVEPKASASGLLTATAVELAVGASSTVTFALPGAMHNGMRAALPTAADELIRWGQRAIELPPHHAAPSVHVGLPDVVLVGESVPVMVNIETGADAICMCTLEVEGGAVNRLQRVGSSTEEISIAVTQSPDGAQGAASVEPTSVFNLAANSRHSTGMYLSAQHIGSITVHVLLKYKALSKESGVEEAGRVMASSTAKVALPFQLDIAVAGPPGVVYALHTAHESGAAEITAQTKGLTVSLPGMEGAFSCSILAPWLPGHVMVPASHPFTLSCNVRCLAGTPLKVTVGHEGGGVAMSPLLPELAGVELGSPGETCAFPFAVGPVAPSEIGSLGNLTISWMRPSSEGNHTISGKLSMALPSATAVAPRLSASVSHPCEGRMGESMCLELQVHSNLERTEEVKVVVGEPNGFLVGGVKEGMAAVAAGASTTLTFTAVPYHAGFLKLPDIMIFHPSGGEPLLATKDCHVFVLPVNYSRS